MFKKLPDIMCFALSLIVIAGVYIEANKHFLPVYLVYLVISTIAICVYIWMFMHHNNEIGLAKMNGREVPEELLNKRRRRMKNFMIIFSPFVFVVLCDSIYLLLLKDNPIFAPILNLFK